jgi:hypothetical protein
MAPGNPRLLVLAGFTAGCAGWTKNEGLLFIAAVSAALLVPVVWKPLDTLRCFGAFLLGLALPLAIILWFKLAVAPPNNLFANRHYGEFVQKVLSPERYLTIVTQLSAGLWSFGNWIINPFILLLAYLWLQRIDQKILRNEAWLQGVSICFIVFAGYAAIYLITPEDLQWQIETTLPRLYLHLWPAFLLLTGLIASNEAY